MKNKKKNFLIWFLIIGGFFLISTLLSDDAHIGANNLQFSEVIKNVESGNVKSVQIKEKNLNGVMTDGSKFYTYLPDYPNLIDLLRAHQVEIDAVSPIDKSDKMINFILGILPFALMIGFWIFFMRGASGGGKALGFGRSKAKLLQENKKKVTFVDVAGIDEAKEELIEIVEFLKEPQKYIKIGARIPKGCLLVGSPGTGKTLLARSVAGEAEVPFFSISGSDFVEMFVGVGASRVRDMFEQAKKNSPCIIFIDEIDAVGRHRGSGIGGGNDEREQTLNQLLVEMDGFSDNEGVIVMAATNRPDVLDKALLRPGRFDRQVFINSPDLIGRQQILKVHAKNVQKVEDLDLEVIARGTPGFSGADLANLINEAALLAAKFNKKLVTLADIEQAKDKILMGPEKRSMVMQQEEKELTAYHEAGHAITAVNCPNSDPIHKATIIPRGRALGLVMRLPTKDRFSVTRAKLLDDLVVAMGGRASEELIFGYDKVTTGAASDIEQATQMAQGMVKKWGLNDKLGPVLYNNEQSFADYGHPITSQYSDKTTYLIDEEVKKIINEAIAKAKKILTSKRKDLEKLAKALLEYETLTGKQIEDLLAGKDIKKQQQKAMKTIKNFIPDLDG